MSGPLDFVDLMHQVVTITPYLGADRYDKQRFGDPVSYRCRISGKRRQVLDGRGELVTSEQAIYLASGDAVNPLSLVTMSTADTGSTAAQSINPPILTVARCPDENGVWYTEIYL